MAKNYLRDAFVTLADQLRLPFAGLDEEHRSKLAGACLYVADVVPETIAADIDDEVERQRVMMAQFMAREILGALFCVELTSGDGEMPAEEQDNLVAFVVWASADLLDEAKGTAPAVSPEAGSGEDAPPAAPAPEPPPVAPEAP